MAESHLLLFPLSHPLGQVPALAHAPPHKGKRFCFQSVLVFCRDKCLRLCRIFVGVLPSPGTPDFEEGTNRSGSKGDRVVAGWAHCWQSPGSLSGSDSPTGSLSSKYASPRQAFIINIFFLKSIFIVTQSKPSRSLALVMGNTLLITSSF